MQAHIIEEDQLEDSTRRFYVHVLEVLEDARIPFLVGGAYALARYTGVTRHTKDLDLFVHSRDVRRVLKVLRSKGYHAEMAFPHWLAKTFRGDDFIDIIFGSGNGIARVDDGWFEHSVEGTVLGVRARLCPVEEMIWSKAFIMERERFDGADLAHLLHARAGRIDWERLLWRFGPHWRVLLSHLVLFGFIYPGERASIPEWVMRDLLGRLQAEQATAGTDERRCQGTLLSRSQYLIDLDRWRYEDARLAPFGTMTPAQIEQWTAAIDWG